MNIPHHIADFLHQYFDKILVLSLPHFTERHQSVKKNLEGLSFDFFWGEDKSLLDYNHLKSTGAYNESKAQKITRHAKPMNLGEITCSLSHRKIYAEMIANKWQRVLVFEDDVLPKYQNLEYLPSALNELPPDWELLYLGFLKNEKATGSLKTKQQFYTLLSRLRLIKWNAHMVSNLLPKPYSTYLRKAGMHDCTHAYALTLSAAEKMLRAQTPVIHRSDDLLSFLATNNMVNAFITEPKFFDQEWFHNPNSISVKTV